MTPVKENAGPGGRSASCARYCDSAHNEGIRREEHRRKMLLSLDTVLEYSTRVVLDVPSATKT